MQTLFLLASLAPLALLPKSMTPSEQRTDIKVGLVAFEDFHSTFASYQRTFAELSRKDP
jgi:hypothetical protein